MARIRWIVVLLFALAPALASAEIVEVGAAQVHAALLSARPALLVDARSPEEYAQAHIPGAINIPAERTRLDAARLPRDRRAPIIFYCRGAG